MSNFAFGKRSKSFLYGNDERGPVVDVVAKLCEKALYYSTVDFSIIDGKRTEAQQQDMFNSGKSELDGVEKLSDHQYGMAIDVLPIVHVDGVKVNSFDVSIPEVKLGWLELYRAFMRASFKLGLVLEFGFGYNVGGGRDNPHISILGYVPKDFSGLAQDPNE